MHKYMNDVCMVLLILGCIIMLLRGIDGEVKSILIMAGSYFFYSAVSRVKKDGDKHG